MVSTANITVFALKIKQRLKGKGLLQSARKLPPTCGVTLILRGERVLRNFINFIFRRILCISFMKVKLAY